MNHRAITYRRLHDIPAEWGTAVNVQAMVFGNMGDDCATGVCFTRDPSTGENMFYGEYLVNAQGEDVVAGIRTPQPLSKARRQARRDADGSGDAGGLRRAAARCARRWNSTTTTCRTSSSPCSSTSCTCCRPATASAPPRASLRMAVEMAHEGLIDRDRGGAAGQPVVARPVAASDAGSEGAAHAAGQGPAGQPGRRRPAPWCSAPTRRRAAR